jgi:hypothetical protein
LLPATAAAAVALVMFGPGLLRRADRAPGIAPSEETTTPTTPTPSPRVAASSVEPIQFEEEPSEAAPSEAAPTFSPPDEVAANHRREVERMLAEAKAEGAEYASAYTSADVWHALDLDGSGAPEYVVFFSTEGYPSPNHYTRFVATYGERRGAWALTSLFAVGGKGWAAVDGEDVALKNGHLTVREVMTYADGDPMCCPSVAAQLTLTVRGQGLAKSFP